MSGLPQWQQALLHLLLQNAFLQLYLPLLSAVSYDPEFSMTTHSEHLPPLPFLTTFSSCHSRLTLKILLFYPLNLIPDWPHSLTQLHWLTNLSSPLTSLLLFSFSSPSFRANANADTHLSSHALFSLAANTNHVQKPTMKECQSCK